MKKLLLFDIDGTLVVTKKGSSGSYNQSIKNLHGLVVDSAQHNLSGMTDKLVLAFLLKTEGWNKEKIAQHMPALIHELETVYLTNFQKGTIQVLPGARKLLTALSQQPAIVLGLITGNLEARARAKLEDVELWDMFAVGAFGSDPHNTRGDLVKLAISRAGFQKGDVNIYVIGDTSRDIRAAKEANVKHKIAIANEYYSKEELKKAGADIVLPNLSNTTAILKKLGVRPKV